MGGIWERVIRSVRRVLSSVMREQAVDDDSLLTMMTMVEGILNGRPLVQSSDDPNDLETITPDDLLLLKSGGTLFSEEFTKEDGYCRRRWRQVQYLANVFLAKMDKRILSPHHV